MTDRPAPTRTQRSAGKERIGENLVLRSGAGCGKTYVLALRFTELLMASADAGESPLRRFVALTFTDKAALEMVQRVRGMLADLAARAKGGDRWKLLGWLEEFDESRISTIHSFCAALLRSHAIEAGLDPAFAVCADDLTASRLLAESADRAVLEAVEQRQADATELISQMPYGNVVDHVEWLVDRRTVWHTEDWADARAVLARWQEQADADRRQAWDRLARDEGVRRLIDEIAAAPCADETDKLADFRRQRLEAVRAILADPDGRKAEDFAALAKGAGNVGSARAWGGAEQVKRMRALLRELGQAVAEYSLFTEDFGPADESSAKALVAMTGLGRRANDLYTAEKRRRGLLDFTDLLAHARRLMEDHPRVREEVRRGIDQLLIDECQDIDAFQARLLARAIFPDEAAMDLFDGSGPLPEGRLFLVGDAKQSIYRFRGAQVEVFEKLCARLGRGHQEGLDESFRTHEAGVAFVNELFAPLMESYEAIRARRKFDGGERGPSVEILLAAGTEDRPVNSARLAALAQAALTAERIRRMIDGGEKLVWDRDAERWRAARAGDIAILLGRMTHSLLYERELADRGVPYCVISGNGFFQQQEVFDLLNALRAIDNPFNDVAFVGVLRSSLVGLDDNALMRLAETHDPPYLPALWRSGSSVAGLDKAAQGRLDFAVGLLRDLHARKDAVGIDRLLEDLLDATGYEGVLSSQFQGRRMLGNVRQLVEQARAASRSPMSLAEFIGQASERILSEGRYEQAPVHGEGDDVVRLMTIHKAKGLEFPVVFVPDLNARRRGSREDLLHRADWDLTLRLRPRNGEEAGGDEEDERKEDASDQPLSSRLARKREQDDELREDIRKLYVAATRHRDHLVLVGADARSQEGAYPKDSYLRMIDDVLHLRAALERGESAIPYGNGRFQAVLSSAPPRPAKASRGASAGRRLLRAVASADELAAGLAKLAPAENALPLVGPLPASRGRAELAVTALSEYEHCPMLYRWRYELRVPTWMLAPGGRAAGPAETLDAATLGTLLHGCMERLDFASPQPAGALVREQAADMGLEDSADLPRAAQELAAMLDAFRRHALWTALAGARRLWRELDFAMDLGPVVLRGQIDALYQDASGAWHVVDYKSDRVGPEGIAAHAERYRRQMELYAAAAAKWLDAPPTDATLYFLRPAETVRLEMPREALDRAAGSARGLAERLIANRRAGRFDPRAESACPFCPYHELCGR